ncbi:MAG: transcriptional regulator [Deltaproteobacteria bacterium RBG_16_58_17]|nr:MAG: transcriptional regulator [Deltaproteobacteria bacterium RBG_16_58_17]OHE18496.1 MAG: transcriptional regulator [Syntrophobacterales bacterium GWC2_56_13]OHE19688.1 MAG: transcriptional regulator [Syntrophobacterales bacterium GWF2_56_9]
MKEVRGQLAGIPLFSGLSGEQYDALARIGVRRSSRKGERIFSEGDEGTGFYVVVTGRVKISKVSAEGKEQILHFFGPGESFGEVSVFTGQGFPADAVAAAQTALLFFPRTSFTALIRNDPALALNMLAQLSQRLRQFAGLIEDLSLKEVPERLAKYLLYLSGRDGDARAAELDVSKGQLASLLGTIPETLSRILTKMNRRGLIRSRGAQITILDRPGLDAIAFEGKKLP